MTWQSSRDNQKSFWTFKKNTPFPNGEYANSYYRLGEIEGKPMIDEPLESKLPEISDAELVDRLANWAKQTLIVNAAQEELDRMEAEVIAAYGERKRGVFSEKAHVAFEKGRRTLEWQQAAMRAGIPPERYKFYAKSPSINWKNLSRSAQDARPPTCARTNERTNSAGPHAGPQPLTSYRKTVSQAGTFNRSM